MLNDPLTVVAHVVTDATLLLAFKNRAETNEKRKRKRKCKWNVQK